MPCRALEAFGQFVIVLPGVLLLSLNALSGIGGVRTKSAGQLPEPGTEWVLMPCRALEAFGLFYPCQFPLNLFNEVLMPCRALEAFGLTPQIGQGLPAAGS